MSLLTTPGHQSGPTPPRRGYAGEGTTLIASGGHADLDLYRQTSTVARPRRRWPACPAKHGLSVLNRATGELVPARCDRLTCFACLVPSAISTARAIAWARPRQWVTLTRVGDSWQAARRQVRRFRQQLQRLGVGGEFAYHVEPNPSGTGQHAHLWWWGDPLDAEIVRRASGGAYAAVGEIWISNNYEIPTLEYGMKMVLWDRPDSPRWLSVLLTEFLDVNGGRLVHQTRDYFRDATGTTVGIDEARRQAKGVRRGTWELVGARRGSP